MASPIDDRVRPAPDLSARSVETRRSFATGRLLLIVAVGTAALAALVVVLGTIVVGRLNAATEVNARVVDARQQVDLVDDLAAELVLRAREPRGPLNSSELLERRGDVIDEEIAAIAEPARLVGGQALLGTEARLDRLADAARGMVDAGSSALSVESTAEADEARELVDVFYRLFRHDLAELDRALTEVESASIRDQTDGVNTISRWVLIAAAVATAVVLAAGFSARRVASRERSLLDLLGRRVTEDPLTGLLNRRGFSEELDRALRQRIRGERLALLFLDLDRFKHVNDSLGHAAGDRLLEIVGERIVGCVRTSDLVGRLGGDEFAVLLRWADDSADAEAAADRLRRAIVKPVDIGDQRVTIGVSIGLRRIAPGECDADELLRDADVAMYDAKRRAGGGVQVFDAGLVSAAHVRLAREEALRAAIAEGDLHVEYQPIFDATQELVGAEALVRWKHDGEIVAPDQFLPLAAEMGLIVDLDRHVLDVATRDIAAINRRFGVDLTVAVNIAAEGFDDDEMVRAVTDALAASGLRPDSLVVEITEQAPLRDLERATATLQALRSMGVAVAIDDFGTGHAALAYLERLPVDIVKIDRSFLPVDGEYGRARELFTAIADLGSRLGFDVVAEGVETQGQFDLATGAGCAYLQGYLLGRPGPIDGLATLAVDAPRAVAAAPDRHHARHVSEEHASLRD